MTDSDRELFEDNLAILAYLKKSRLFSHFPEETLRELLPLSNLSRIPGGTQILVEGEPNDRVFFLIEGCVEVYASGELILKLRRKGDIFGEMSVISEKVCTASVIAATPVYLFSVLSHDIGRYTDLNPEKLQNILYRVFSMILTEKLVLTTKKAKQYELTNRRLNQTQDTLQSAHSELGRQLQKLKETTISKNFFNNTIQSMLSTMVVITPEATIQLVNPPVLELLDYTEEEIIGKSYQDLIFQEEFEQLAEKQGMSQNIFAIANVEVNYRAKSGKLIPMLYSGSAIHNDQGKIQGYVCVAQDITLRKQMEDDLEASKESFHNIVELNSDGAVILNYKGIVKYHNAAAAKLLGRPSHELLDQPFADSFKDTSLKEIEIFQNGQKHVLETRVTATEWEGIPASLLSIRDITERKTIELELLEAKSQLEQSNSYLLQLNQEMTNELEQARLTQLSLFQHAIPQGSGFQIAQKYVPIEQIGGDFYDFLDLGKKIGLLVADVAGHGVSAALLSFMAFGLFKNFASQNQSPLETIELLNDALYQKMPENKFVSVFYGTYDLETRVFKYVSGGHPPGYVLRKTTGEIIPLASKGILLGVIQSESIDFELGSYQMIPGDKLFLYTDGIVEIENNDGKIFGQPRLQEVLKESLHLELNVLLETAYDKVLRFAEQSEFDDDITLIGFEVTA